MRINARLDEAHSKKLAYLQKVFRAGVSDVIKQAGRLLRKGEGCAIRRLGRPSRRRFCRLRAGIA